MTIDKRVDSNWRYTISPIEIDGKIEYQFILLMLKDEWEELWESVVVDIAETEVEAENTIKVLLDMAGVKA